jgi:hypothetical protein
LSPLGRNSSNPAADGLKSRLWLVPVNSANLLSEEKLS